MIHKKFFEFLLVDGTFEISLRALIINSLKKGRMMVGHILVIHIGLQIRQVHHAIIAFEHVKQIRYSLLHRIFIFLVELNVYFVHGQSV